MTWYCDEYGKNILGISYKLDDCEHCHLKDKCVRESIEENTELPFFLTFEEAFLVSEMFDSHPSEISSKMAKQTLTIKLDEFYMWVETENLYNHLVRVLDDYKKMWELDSENLEKVKSDDAFIKVSCPACNGDGYLTDEDFETKKEIKTLCPSCRGSGYTFSEIYMEKNTNET